VKLIVLEPLLGHDIAATRGHGAVRTHRPARLAAVARGPVGGDLLGLAAEKHDDILGFWQRLRRHMIVGRGAILRAGAVLKDDRARDQDDRGSENRGRTESRESVCMVYHVRSPSELADVWAEGTL